MKTAPARTIRLALAVIALAAGGTGVGAEDVSGGADLQEEAVMRCFALRRSEPATAVELAESILRTRPLAVDNEIKALSCLGMAAGIAGDAVRAAETAERIETLLDAHPMPNDFALRALSNAGAIFHTAGRIARAEALYLRAYAVAQADDAVAAQVVTLTNIALIHADYLDAADVADGYYRKALSLGTEHDYEDLQLLYNHAVNLMRLGAQDEAWDLLGRAEAEAQRVENSLLRLRIGAERAALLHARGETAQARALLEEATAEQARLPDPAGQALSLAKLSVLQRESGELRAALRSAEAAVSLVEDGSFRRALLDSLAALAGAHAAYGKADAALAAAERRHALQRSALKEYDRQTLAGLQAQLQDAAGVRELERLRHAGEIQALRMERDRLVRNWMIAAFLLFVGVALGFVLLQRRLNKHLQTLSTVDMLTGLINRRAATEHLGRRFSQDGGEDGARDVLLLIDVDRFKSINDRFGHDIGDRVLTEVAARLKSACRPDDIVARWGGEEFLVACPGLSREQACVVAERLRKAAADTPIALSAHHQLPLTVSIGFAPFPFFAGSALRLAPITWQDAIRLADRALYAVKNSGRNAWAGLWGQSEAATASLDVIFKDPERAARREEIAVVSSRPVVWRVVQADGSVDPLSARLPVIC